MAYDSAVLADGRSNTNDAPASWREEAANITRVERKDTNAGPKTRSALMPSVTCPTCGMSASPHDHRQLIPVSEYTANDVEFQDIRSCRNCGDVITLMAQPGATA